MNLPETKLLVQYKNKINGEVYVSAQEPISYIDGVGFLWMKKYLTPYKLSEAFRIRKDSLELIR